LHVEFEVIGKLFLVFLLLLLLLLGCYFSQGDIVFRKDAYDERRMRRLWSKGVIHCYPDLCYLGLEGVESTRQTVVGCAKPCFYRSHSGWFSNAVVDIQVCSSEDLQARMTST
jgi:hypothetical protein